MTTFSHAPVEVPLAADRDGPVSLTAQITAQLRTALAGGHFMAGERLPSTRALAVSLGVSRTVVTTVYAQLFAEGWLEGRHGSGTYVADVAPGLPLPAAPPAPAPCRQSAGWGPDRTPEMIELQPGIPWAAGIEPDVWRRAWRQAGTRPPSSWPDPHGIPELRAELAAYLRRSRGLNITPENILITRGVASGLATVAAALVSAGDKAGVEEPGYPAAREVLRRAGAQVVPCRVDEHGIIPDELPVGLRLLYTTPAHQYPLGGRLPIARRQALTAWARATGALIVEDDYDGEFRYDVAPLQALYSLAPDVVVYLGTTSKMLTPVLGIGWLTARPDLVGLLAAKRREISERVPEPVQHALHTLLTSGDLERHIRRMRLEYARRRAVLVQTLPWPVLGDTAGMHVVLELPASYPAEQVVATAAARGLALHAVNRYYAARPPSTPSSSDTARPPSRNSAAPPQNSVPSSPPGPSHALSAPA